VHRAHLVQQWVAQHSDQLELFYLPAYSPEQNPDEYLNQDIKANAIRQRRPRNNAELKRAVLTEPTPAVAREIEPLLCNILLRAVNT